eukprot:TRINITY_DN10271_c0_g1_i1.p1 TRINITY_DN10271_c0_g1~~TRINITY_DN10271_c0_g1_i1.p1  ORF type:complete len:112 (+),score=4.70 TRINITY_DN10271_c0_g1_i1:3-338(+)
MLAHCGEEHIAIRVTGEGQAPTKEHIHWKYNLKSNEQQQQQQQQEQRVRSHFISQLTSCVHRRTLPFRFQSNSSLLASTTMFQALHYPPRCHVMAHSSCRRVGDAAGSKWP